VKRLAKSILALVGVVLLVLAALVIGISLLFDPNDYKGEIAGVVKEHTGRDLIIDGELKLSLFPWLSIKTGTLALANSPGFGDEPMARVAAAGARIRLLPLLKRRVEVDTVLLQGLKLNLITDRAGRTNWADLGAAEPVGPKGDAVKVPEPAAPGLALAAIVVQGVDIRQGQVNWDNRAARRTYTLHNLHLKTGKLVAGRPATVRLNFELEGTNLPRRLPLTVDSTVSLDLEKRSLVLEGLSLEATGGEITAAMALPRAEMNIDRGTLAANDLSVTVAGLPAQLRLQIPKIGVDLENQTLSVPKFLLNADGVRLHGNLSGTRIVDAPRYTGSLDIPEFNLRQFLHTVGVDVHTMDLSAFSRASLKGRLNADSDRLGVTRLVAVLDESNLTGSFTVRNFAKPSYRFDLAVDGIDLDRYFPPGEKQEDKKGAEPGRVPGTALFALLAGAIRGLDADGALHIKKLKAAGVMTQDIEVRVASANGVFRVTPLRARLYGGGLRGEIRYDVRGDEPVLGVNEKLSSVQLEPLLTDAGITKKLSGRGDLDVQLVGRGAQGQRILRTLKGHAVFLVSDGMIKGLDIRNMILAARRLRAELRGKEVEVEVNEKDEFRFTEMTGKLVFVDGIVRNDDLYIKSPLFRITGKGSADLIRETVNYLLNVTITATGKGQGGEELEELKGYPIPIRIKGKLGAPDFTVDIEAAVRAEIKRKIRKELEKRILKELSK